MAANAWNTTATTIKPAIYLQEKWNGFHISEKENE